MKQDRRGSWYLLTGLVFGAAIGLFYSWMVSPVKYVDAPPYALREDYKDDYRALVAAAYMYSGDLLRAKDRLAQLKDNDMAQSVARQAQQALASGHSEEEVRALGILAMDLERIATPVVQSLTPEQNITSATPTTALTPTPLIREPTASPSMTAQAEPIIITPLPPDLPIPGGTAADTLTPGAPFVLQDTQLVCNINQAEPLIQVEVSDAAAQPVAGVELVAAWDGGEDHFFTGLKPELGVGYADFVMSPGVIYSIRLVDGELAKTDLAAPQCVAEDGSNFWGSWHLTFGQP